MKYGVFIEVSRCRGVLCCARWVIGPIGIGDRVLKPFGVGIGCVALGGKRIRADKGLAARTYAKFGVSQAGLAGLGCPGLAQTLCFLGRHSLAARV